MDHGAGAHYSGHCCGRRVLGAGHVSAKSACISYAQAGRGAGLQQVLDMNESGRYLFLSVDGDAIVQLVCGHRPELG